MEKKMKMTDNIKHNRVKCLECDTILESFHRHDYKTCTCPNQTAVDGGHSYLRYGGVDFNKVLLLTEYYTEEEWEEILRVEQSRPITLVSARDYLHFCKMLNDPLEPKDKLKKLFKNKKVDVNEENSEDPDNTSH